MNGSGQYIDLGTWVRREMFDFFKTFEQPFFNICATVDVQRLRSYCKQNGIRFNQACWFACQAAINQVDQLRTRIRGERVFLHDHIGMSVTALNDNETFRFANIGYHSTFEAFSKVATEKMKGEADIMMDDKTDIDDVVWGSTLPWIHFTSVEPARRQSGQSIPKIVLGKFKETTEGLMMPVSLEAHHALVDGVHAGKFYNALQAALDSPDTLLR